MRILFSWATFTYIVSFSEEVKRAAYAGRVEWFVEVFRFQ